jgi:transcription termination factor NusB
MDSTDSLSKQAKKLEKYIYTLKAARELNELDRLPRESIMRLRDAISAARGAVDRYNGSDDTKEQELAHIEAVDQLKIVGEAILESSQYDLLDIADVAHLSALNEYIIDQLR